MMKKITAVLLMLVLLIGAAAVCAEPDTIWEQTTANGTVYTYKAISCSGRGGYTEFFYSDEMLLEDVKPFSTDLVKASVGLASAAYDAGSIKETLEQMGYSSQPYQYDTRSFSDNDKVAYTVGVKNVAGAGLRIVCAAIKGTSGDEEWFSNFRLGYPGEDNNGEHVGFRLAANDVINTLNTAYNVNDGKTILWVTGHSRGAAVANIVAAKFTEAMGAKRVFGYTFACPNVSKTVKAYANIHNFNNAGDMITIMPLSDWGYGRNGIDYTWNYGPDVSAAGGQYNGATDTLAYAEIMKILVPSEADYFDAKRQLAINLLALAFQDNSDSSWKQVVQEYGPAALTSIGKYVLEKIIDKCTGFPDALKKIFHWKDDTDEATEILDQFISDISTLTDSEFADYLNEHQDVVNQIAELTGEVISQIDDAGIIKATVISMGSAAQSIGKLIGCVMDLCDHTTGKVTSAIAGAHDMTSYLLAMNRKYYGYEAYRDADIEPLILPSNIHTIGPFCFEGSTLQSITLHNGLKAIGDYAFHRCTGMTALTVPNSVQLMGNGCLPVSLTSLSIPFVGESRWGHEAQKQVFNYIFGLQGQYYPWSELEEGTASVYAGEAGSYVYLIPSLLTEVSITDTTVIPAYAFENMGGANRLTAIHLPDNLEIIGDSAFYSCKDLTGDFMIPEGVWEIGIYSFGECEGITGLILPTTLESISQSALYNCTGLTELALPEGLYSIDDYALDGCTGITELTVPDGVRYIGNGSLPVSLTRLTIPYVGAYPDEEEGPRAMLYYAFGYTEVANPVGDPGEGYAYIYSGHDWGMYRTAPNLKEVTVTNTLQIPSYAFNNQDNTHSITAIYLPERLQKIGDCAFYDCGSLTGKMTIPETVSEIGAEAFSGCVGITSINLPEKVTVLNSGVLYGCSGLTNLTLPAKLESLGERALSECSGLTTLTVPDTVKTMGNGCLPTSLTSLTIPFVGSSREVSGTHDAIFNYLLGYEGKQYADWTQSEGYAPIFCQTDGWGVYRTAPNLKEVTITNTLQIPEHAFDNQDNANFIEAIHLPDGLETIRGSAFYHCLHLTGKMTIPETVSEIGQLAFAGCTGITEINIPELVTELNNGILYGCNGLKELTLHPKLKRLKEDALAGCSGLTTLTVPDSVLTMESGCLPATLTSLTIPFVGSSMEADKTYDSIFNYVFGYLGKQAAGESLGEGYAAIPSDTDGWGIYKTAPKLKEVTITAAEQIPGGAFRNDEKANVLETIRLPEGLKRIGESAFYHCGNLAGEFVIPDGVAEIKPYTFDGCGGITELTVPKSLTTIGSNAFAECGKLGVIWYKGAPKDWKKVVTAEGNDPLAQCDLRYIAVYLPTDIVIPSGVTEIQEEAFAGIPAVCIQLPEGVTTVKSRAFASVSDLGQVYIPQTLKEIAEDAFEGCRHLVVIGGSVAEAYAKAHEGYHYMESPAEDQ